MSKISFAGILCLVGLILLFPSPTVRAQTNDSVVNFEADVAGLSLTSLESLPTGGTFWVVTSPGDGVNGVMPPYPCLPANVSYGNIYTLPNGAFLVDASGNDGDRQQVLSQINAVSNVIELSSAPVATSRPMAMHALAESGPPDFSDTNSDDSGTNYLPIALNFTSINTNRLWLEITNVSNQIAYLNLHDGTNKVYGIYATPDLTIPFTNWLPVQEVWPTNATTNTLPFTVVANNQTNTFYRALDWTGFTEHGNTTPDWWFYEWFGTTALSDTNMDSQSNTFLSDYQNGVDPNVIDFTLSVPNNYVNSVNLAVALQVLAGIPYYFAVSVDDTNYANDASWQTYAGSSINVNLGLTPGWHSVWVGLKGCAANATATWQWKHINLTMPPILAIINPVSSTIDEPMIQINGYCQESLSSISYDISNALGAVTGQPSEITDKFYDTNIFSFTTNYFECLDVPLTNGLNVITIHATDLAGDTTTTNFNFTLDYSSKTNPPVVQITWPQNGTQISGSNFTIRGFVIDPTVTASAQVLSPTGNTNVYAAEIERNGKLWLENLPAIAGTNTFVVTVTDAVGNRSVTNISVIQSALVLTVNPVTPASELWQPAVNLTGSISDATYAVWVNGVKGHNNGNGTWSASNVPVNSGGTASFTAIAYSPTEPQPDGSYGN